MNQIILLTKIDLFSPENIAGYAATAVVAILGFLVTWILVKILLYKPLKKVSDQRAEAIESGMKANLEEQKRLSEQADLLVKKEQTLQSDFELQIAKEKEDNRKASEKIITEAKQEAAEIIRKANQSATTITTEEQLKRKQEITQLAMNVVVVVLQDEQKAKQKEAEISLLVNQMLQAKK